MKGFAFSCVLTQLTRYRDYLGEVGQLGKVFKSSFFWLVAENNIRIIQSMRDFECCSLLRDEEDQKCGGL
jgi:hypothetical protein